MKERFLKLLCRLSIVLIVGLVYALWIKLTGLGIPCVIKALTGLSCPGCGVSRMCMALLGFDFVTAFKSNAAIFCMLPLWGIIFGAQALRYIRTGSSALKKWQNVSIVFSIVVLLCFGIVRNILH